jgi:acetyl-CoA carboxylase biotin carboxylase subunit
VFERVLVANRGEIAVRVIRAVHELGAEAVAVYSEADRDALHVRLADFAYPVGPPPAAQSYLNGAAILEAARRGGAQAVHPGYGFLSENAAFARECEGAGLVFVGPTPEALGLMGDKVAARRLAAAAGVPTVPGTAEPVEDAAALAAAAEIGFPLLIKAAAGGGGKGMRAVRQGDDLPAALAQARREAQASFGDGRVYLERAVERPRHVEVQLFGDGSGRVLHLGERDCSLQRRFQKVVEEAPAPNLPDAVRARLWEAAVAAAGAARYRGAGTIEFLYEPGSERFYFLEMNARLQVEHPVTELVAGVDLVQAQLRLAAGESLEEALGGAVHGPTSPPGWHAVEARIMAEDPLNGWLPSTGSLGLVREPGGLGVRVDSACEPGQAVSVHYDPLLAKLICWGRNRNEAIARLRRALDEYVLTGVRSSLPFHRWLVRQPDFLAGEVSTSYIAERWEPVAATMEAPAEGGGAASILDADQLRVAALVAATAVAERERLGAGRGARSESGPGSRWRRIARREAAG